MKRNNDKKRINGAVKWCRRQYRNKFFFKNNEKESPRMSSTIYRMPGKQMKFDEKSGKLVSSIIFSNFESKGINNELK